VLVVEEVAPEVGRAEEPAAAEHADARAARVEQEAERVEGSFHRPFQS
jgi:hypothetical protein